MTDATYPPETTPSPVGGVVAFLAVAAVALAVGGTAGVTELVGVTVLGGGALWLAIRWHVGEDRLRERASDGDRPAPESPRTHSFQTVLAAESLVGLALGAAAALLTAPTAYTLLYVGGDAVVVSTISALAVTAVVLAGAVGDATDEDRSPGVQRVLGGTFDTLAGGTVVTLATALCFGLLALFVGVVAAWLTGSVPGLSPGASGPTDFQSLVVLQLLFVAAVFAVPRADATAERMLFDSDREPPGVVARLDELPASVPSWYWILLVVQLFAVFAGFDVPVFASFTAVTGVLGVALRAVVAGLVPLALLAVLAVSGAVLLAGLLQRFLAESDLAGPVVTRLTVAHLPITVGVVLLFQPLEASGVPFAVARTVVGVILTTLTVSLGLYTLVVLARFLPAFDGAEWYGLASLLTLSLGFVGAAGSASPFVVYLAVAAGLFVWYVGETATVLGEQLGRTADTASGEATHAVAVGGVLALAVGLVSAITYFVGVPTALLDGTRSAAAVVFLSVAALAVIARDVGVGTEEE